MSGKREQEQEISENKSHISEGYTETIEGGAVGS